MCQKHIFHSLLKRLIRYIRWNWWWELEFIKNCGVEIIKTKMSLATSFYLTVKCRMWTLTQKYYCHFNKLLYLELFYENDFICPSSDFWKVHWTTFCGVKPVLSLFSGDWHLDSFCHTFTQPQQSAVCWKTTTREEFS